MSLVTASLMVAVIWISKMKKQKRWHNVWDSCLFCGWIREAKHSQSIVQIPNPPPLFFWVKDSNIVGVLPATHTSPFCRSFRKNNSRAVWDNNSFLGTKTYWHTRTEAYTPTHIYTDPHILTHIHMRAHTHTHTHTYIYYIYTHTLTQTFRHTCTHPYTDINMQTDVRKHT